MEKVLMSMQSTFAEEVVLLNRMILYAYAYIHIGYAYAVLQYIFI